MFRDRISPAHTLAVCGLLLMAIAMAADLSMVGRLVFGAVGLIQLVWATSWISTMNEVRARHCCNQLIEKIGAVKRVAANPNCSQIAQAEKLAHDASGLLDLHDWRGAERIANQGLALFESPPQQ